MIVGFSRHGTGGGGGPVGYVTDKRRPGRENSPPEVLRGSPEATRNLIDSLDFRHKYTSGVLSFAPKEKVTPEMEQAFMDRFEQVAFAGLEADQYNILWVRHTHAGHHELHFVTPRVELGTGKSLNIRPPGDAAKQAFDDLRSEINARYGLADPDDPRRAREIAQPDHELKIAAEALRRGEKPQEDVRLLIDAVFLSQRAAQGLIRSRSDVIEQVSDLGMQVTREGKNYITVSDPQSGQRWRMKGDFMSVSLTLQERLKQQHLAESETIQSLTKQQLSSLRSELNGIFQQELNTMLEDMRRQLHVTTEDMRQSRQSMLLTIVKNRVIFPALSAVTILAVIFLSGWGLSTFQESQIMANWQQINSQKATLATLESKTAGLNIVQDKNGTFVVLPKGAKVDDSGWTVGKQQALRIVR